MNHWWLVNIVLWLVKNQQLCGWYQQKGHSKNAWVMVRYQQFNNSALLADKRFLKHRLIGCQFIPWVWSISPSVISGGHASFRYSTSLRKYVCRSKLGTTGCENIPEWKQAKPSVGCSATQLLWWPWLTHTHIFGSFDPTQLQPPKWESSPALALRDSSHQACPVGSLPSGGSWQCGDQACRVYHLSSVMIRALWSTMLNWESPRVAHYPSPQENRLYICTYMYIYIHICI